MKKILAVLVAASLFAIGTLAYAHGTGGWGGGHMMGSGYGEHMAGPGYGHMYERTGADDQKFLDDTADLRKELHTKKFEYFEAARNPETTNETISKLRDEIRTLEDKINEKAPKTEYGRFGCRW